MAWGTAGKLTDPGANAVLADTGPLAAVAFVPTLICWANVACLITLRHRNAANNADVHAQQLSLTTEGDNSRIFGLPSSVTLGLNERLILTLDIAIVGQIQCSIITG